VDSFRDMNIIVFIRKLKVRQGNADISNASAYESTSLNMSALKLIPQIPNKSIAYEGEIRF
jgi:hypothetical protein